MLADLSKNILLGAKKKISEYHASTLSYRESPVLNGAPNEGSLAGYNALNSLSTPRVRVVLSKMRSPIKLSNTASSDAPLQDFGRARTDWAKKVPSFS